MFGEAISVQNDTRAGTLNSAFRLCLSLWSRLWSVQPRDEQNPSTSFSRDGHSQLLERKSILECAVTNAVKRPPRAPEDVQCNMNRDPPFQRRARRFGSEIIGKKTNVKASVQTVHAAAMSKVAEDCIAATLSE